MIPVTFSLPHWYMKQWHVLELVVCPTVEKYGIFVTILSGESEAQKD